MEKIGNIPKIKDLGLPEDAEMAINCEWYVLLLYLSSMRESADKIRCFFD